MNSNHSSYHDGELPSVSAVPDKNMELGSSTHNRSGLSRQLIPTSTIRRLLREMKIEEKCVADLSRLIERLENNTTKQAGGFNPTSIQRPETHSDFSSKGMNL